MKRDFNRDETAEMTAILGYKGTGNRTNESYFERNKEGYDEFAFRMGVYYFYYYEASGLFRGGSERQSTGNDGKGGNSQCGSTF